MSWKYDTSRERIEKHLASLGEIEVEPLVREMDLENLSETNCRQIYGAHVYAEIRNLSTLAGTMTSDEDRRLLVQATHVYQRELDRIANAIDASRIQFQGGRAHFLAYRPIRDAKRLATKAVIVQLVVDRLGEIFSSQYPHLPDLHIRSGSDMGEAIGTRNGTHGDRELLFLGASANHAAKLLPVGADRRLTAAVKDTLPPDLVDLVQTDPDGEFRLLRPSTTELDELLAGYDVDWSAEDATRRLEEERAEYPVTDVGLSGALEKIDFDELSFFNTKIVAAATVYGDVSGFTGYIDSATTREEQQAAVRAFHAIRREMARVVKDDHAGVRVQFQGDRVQALFHLPPDEATVFSNEAVSAAIGLQSSFELVLKDLVPGIKALGIAAGISQGATIATKLGERGHRDRLCLGAEVLRAERNEEHVGKQQIGISANVREQLPEDRAELFVWNAAANCYVATGLDHNKLDLAEASRDLSRGGSVYVKASPAGAIISTRPGSGRERRPAASHSE